MDKITIEVDDPYPAFSDCGRLVRLWRKAAALDGAKGAVFRMMKCNPRRKLRLGWAPV